MTPERITPEKAAVLLADAGEDPIVWGRLKEHVMALGVDGGWDQLIVLADATDDEDTLAMLAVVAAEPLLQTHWRALVPRIHPAVEDHPNLREVLRGVMISAPDDVTAVLNALAD